MVIISSVVTGFQIESFLHYMEDDLFQELKDKVDARSWWSKGHSPAKGSDGESCDQ